MTADGELVPITSLPKWAQDAFAVEARKATCTQLPLELMSLSCCVHLQEPERYAFLRSKLPIY